MIQEDKTMATTYSSGNKTKEKIIKATRILLYKKGFSNTTYDDISNATKINRALIPYHFKSKQQLGQIIYSQIITDFFSSLDSILDVKEFSADFVSTLHITAYYQLLTDSSFVQFVNELQNDISFSSFMEQSEYELMEGLIQKSNKLSPTEKSILLTSAVGMKKELIRMVNNKKADVNDIAKMQLYMLLSYCGYSKKKIEELYDSAMQVIHMFTFQITSDFRIDILYK